MNRIHALMVAASAGEMYSESGTYLMALVQCAACLSQFVLRNWFRSATRQWGFNGNRACVGVHSL